MIVLLDVFRAYRVESCRDWLASNNIEYVCVPGNCTDKLQPMDLAVNKPFKCVMMKEFISGIVIKYTVSYSTASR